jgi:hypothetical protein
MLGCGWIGAFFAPGSGNVNEFWVYAAPYPQWAEGAAIGLLIELAIRFYFWSLGPLRTPMSSRDESEKPNQDKSPVWRVGLNATIILAICLITLYVISAVATLMRA